MVVFVASGSAGYQCWGGFLVSPTLPYGGCELDYSSKEPAVNVQDLKAYYRGHKYVAETLKWLPQKSEPILMARIFDNVSHFTDGKDSYSSPGP
jgi:hypothetical protein